MKPIPIHMKEVTKTMTIDIHVYDLLNFRVKFFFVKLFIGLAKRIAKPCKVEAFYHVN
jgi:hypothetical protein